MIEDFVAVMWRHGLDPDAVRIVFDIGSRDGEQAIELSHLFPAAHVYAVECNPETLARCRASISSHSNITLIEKAVNGYTGRCKFYPIDTKRTITTWPDGNPGASSLFRATGDYPVEQYEQNEIEVDCIRLDDLCDELRIHAIDVIWLDIQGAELLALQSAGSLLKTARYLYLEVSHRAIYDGQCMFEEVDAFLRSQGFQLCSPIDKRQWQHDAVYKNDGKPASLFVEREALRTERDTLKRERDTLKSERDALKSERNALEREHAALTSERDVLKRDREVLQIERDTLRSDCDVLRVERDALKAERDALRNERDTLRNLIETWRRRLRWPLWLRRRLRELLSKRMT